MVFETDAKQDSISGLHGIAEDPTEHQILDAALKLFLEQGYGSVTNDQVCAAAGVSRDVLRNHFATKESLYCMVVDRESARTLRLLEDELPQQGTSREILRAGIHLYIKVTRSSAYAALLSVAKAEASQHPSLIRFFQTPDGEYQIQALASSIVSKWIESGALRSANPAFIARQILGMLAQATVHEPAITGRQVADLDDYVESVCELLQRSYGQ